MKKILAPLSIAVIFICIVSIKKFCPYSQPDLTIIGSVNMADGLGRQSAELIEALQGEMKINFISTGKQKKKTLPKALRPFLKEKKDKWGKVIIFEDMLWAPKQERYRKILQSDPHSIRIAYSMWESTKIPSEWVMILNDHFDAVAVPASFLIDTYVNSGVKIPVFELPLGLNLDHFLTQPLKQKPGDPFTFGNLSVCSERKNQALLVRAFAKAFGNDPSVRLRINCRYGEKEVSQAITKEIVNSGLNNIIFTQFSLPKEKYLHTFQEIDCYVSPSKGEGFSIQPREAMALGIPVVVTNNTGQIPICESGLVKIVETHLLEAALFPWGNCYGQYFNCSVDELAQSLIEVKSNYSSYLARGEQARQWAEQYQYQKLKILYRALISPKHVVLGEENRLQEDSLITNSPALYEKYKRRDSRFFMSKRMEK